MDCVYQYHLFSDGDTADTGNNDSAKTNFSTITVIGIGHFTLITGCCDMSILKSIGDTPVFLCMNTSQ